ncbi:MAG: hypothetical protein GXY86_07305 [Firmicutes bacterium]|nr:hypothetical protein [Bacillota bacterium]
MPGLILKQRLRVIEVFVHLCAGFRQGEVGSANVHPWTPRPRAVRAP